MCNLYISPVATNEKRIYFANDNLAADFIPPTERSYAVSKKSEVCHVEYD